MRKGTVYVMDYGKGLHLAVEVEADDIYERYIKIGFSSFV